MGLGRCFGPAPLGDIIIRSNRLGALPEAGEIARRSYAKMVQDVVLAFAFNGATVDEDGRSSLAVALWQSAPMPGDVAEAAAPNHATL